MSADDELEIARKKFEDKMKERLAKKIVKISEEDFFPSRLKTCIVILKVVCVLAVFVCAPILGFLYTEMAKGTIATNMLILYLFPMLFIGIITAIVSTMKTPE